MISPYFRNLRTAYFAELDDLTFDSDGAHILEQRLKQRRKEMEFLVHMMEISPEMVAVVLHKAFRFKSLAVMDNLLTYESEDLPEWDTIADTIELAPWTKPLLATIQKQPQGDWFLSVAAALEYMYSKPEHPRGASASDEDEDGDDGEDGDHENRADHEHEDPEEAEARAREEAGADWLAEQGFDRKE